MGHICLCHIRTAVSDVLRWLANGMSHEEIMADYPELVEDDIRTCLAYAADQTSSSYRSMKLFLIRT